MFYSAELLSRKDAMGKIWMAGTGLLNKLGKRAITSTDVVVMSESIIHPKEDLALRLQAILMHGVCVIYEKKSHYLMDDASNMLYQVSRTPRLRGGKKIDLPSQRGNDHTLQLPSHLADDLGTLDPTTDDFTVDLDLLHQLGGGTGAVAGMGIGSAQDAMTPFRPGELASVHSSAGRSLAPPSSVGGTSRGDVSLFARSSAAGLSLSTDGHLHEVYWETTR